MPRHDDIFDFSPEALRRTQRAELNGASICYVGTESPGVVYFWGLEVEPEHRGQGRCRTFLEKLNEHCDATGTTRMSKAMSRTEGFEFEKIVNFYISLGFETLGTVEGAGSAYPTIRVVRRPRPPSS